MTHPPPAEPPPAGSETAALSDDPRRGRAHIAWPAPAQPALVEPGARRLELVVAGGSPSELSAWARDLALAASGRERIPVASAVAREASRAELERRVGAWAARADASHARRGGAPAIGAPAIGEPAIGEPAIVEIELERPLPGASDGARVYDLVRGRRLERSRAVAPLPGGRRLAVAIASDLHIASAFRDVLDEIRAFDRELARELVDPDAQLEAFIDRANALAAAGELDLVVFAGDLVDHARPGRGAAPSETNARRLERALRRLRVPSLAVPGNHDHRLYPWRARIARLTGGAASEARVRAALRAAERWDALPLRPADYEALRTTSRELPEPLIDHARELAPAADYGLRVGPLALLFANSGADALLHWRHLEARRLPALARAQLAGLRSAPPSEGPRPERLDALLAESEGARGIALFMHAPALAPPLRSPTPELRPALERAAAGESARADAYLQRAAAGKSALCRGGAAVLAALRGAGRPAILFSGHVHRASALAIEGEKARPEAISFAEAPGRPLVQAVAPALGARGDEPGGEPGYLLARFDDGALVSLERRPLTDPRRRSS